MNQPLFNLAGERVSQSALQAGLITLAGSGDLKLSLAA
jgi:hypothetical protein